MSRWTKDEADDRPLSFEEFQEMRLSFEREVRQLKARWDAGDRSWAFRTYPMRKLSRREVKYLEMCESDVGDLFG